LKKTIEYDIENPMEDHRGRDNMVVGFTTTSVIIAYHHIFIKLYKHTDIICIDIHDACFLAKKPASVV
jgi:hypothetical protein